MPHPVVARYDADLLLRAHDRLGESPVWDDRSGVLHRVDAVAGLVQSTHPATGHARTYDVGRHVGCVVLREDGPACWSRRRTASTPWTAAGRWCCSPASTPAPTSC